MSSTDTPSQNTQVNRSVIESLFEIFTNTSKRDAEGFNFNSVEKEELSMLLVQLKKEVYVPFLKFADDIDDLFEKSRHRQRNEK